MNPLFRSTTTPRFWACFNALRVEIQEQATKQYELFLENPFHPSLRLKQIDVFWPVRIGRSHGALATREGDLFAWFWIGPHDEYERILKETRLACDRAFRSGRQPLQLGKTHFSEECVNRFAHRQLHGMRRGRCPGRATPVRAGWPRRGQGCWNRA